MTLEFDVNKPRASIPNGGDAGKIIYTALTSVQAISKRPSPSAKTLDRFVGNARARGANENVKQRYGRCNKSPAN